MVRRSTALLDAGGAAHQCIRWWADQKPCMVLDLGSARVKDPEPGSRSMRAGFSQAIQTLLALMREPKW